MVPCFWMPFIPSFFSVWLLSFETQTAESDFNRKPSWQFRGQFGVPLLWPLLVQRNGKCRMPLSHKMNIWSTTLFAMACVLVLCRNLWRGERELRERKKYFQLFSLFSLYANGIFLGKKQTEKKLEHYIGEGVGGATSEVPRIIIPKKNEKETCNNYFALTL